MDKGRNSAQANFGSRPGVANQAQRPKRPDGPSRPARSVHAQHAHSRPARWLEPGTVTGWGSVAVESTSGARLLAAELTGATQPRGGREKRSTRRSSTTVRRAVTINDLGWAPIALRKEEEHERQLNPMENHVKATLTTDTEESMVVVVIQPVSSCFGGSSVDER
jgi:hypothetical protein